MIDPPLALYSPASPAPRGFFTVQARYSGQVVARAQLLAAYINLVRP